MATLMVNIIAGNTRIDGTKIQSKAQVGAIAKQVAKAVGNPLVDENNDPIVYSFTHNDEHVLDPEHKVGDCGIRTGDKLLLTRQGVPVKGEELPPPPNENTVSVLIVLPNSTKYEKTLITETGIVELIDTIIAENNLEREKRYELKSRHHGTVLTSGTLASNKIPPRDTLTLGVDAIAGCIFI